MTPERWREVTRIFHAAVARDPAARAAFLAEACGPDPALRAEVEAMVAADLAAGSFGDTPVFGMPGQACLAPGTRIGAFRIDALLGLGGMGEVYRARDTTLDRDVAIKILPTAFIRDPDRLARFEREARVLASLNHSHIGAIYGVEEIGEQRALVLELVEGETLDDRIARGPIRVDEALAIAGQIADALDAAHERGIVHRDLKPANIKITPDGMVKVLDFGLAKAVSGSSGGMQDMAHAQAMAQTRAGLLLGTAPYMSPEQARGEAVDKRADIWAFGCVLYEMLTGRAAFDGKTMSDTIAAILTQHADFSALPPETPSSIRTLLRRTLARDARERLRDLGDARIEIAEALRDRPAAESPVAPRRGSRWLSDWRMLVAGMALVALTAAAITWTATRSRLPALVPESRLAIVTPPTAEPASIAISPDGRTVAFVADSDTRSVLWLRALDAESARPLTGTDGATFPFWSPDSGSIGFFADGKLKRIDASGGSPQTLADASAPAGGAWNDDGTILFAPIPVGPIVRVSAGGGTPSPVSRLEPGQSGHQWPRLLPDGLHFVYVVMGKPEVRGVYIGGIDGSSTSRLLDVPAGALYASAGYLLFVREGTLFAQPLDPGRLTLTGSPVRVADEVALDVSGASWSPVPAVSASSAGSIVYRSNVPGGSRLTWFDRSGRELSRVGDVIPTQGRMLLPSLSPDGTQMALGRVIDGNADLWLLDLERNVPSRFTFDATSGPGAAWSPDGRSLVFNSNRNGVQDLYRKSLAGSGGEEALATTKPALGNFLNDISPDGRFLLYEHVGSPPTTLLDLWALPLQPPGDSFPVVQTSYEEQQGRFAFPDGKWIAYSSNESGQFEIYVRPLRTSDGRRRVSINGGTQPRWRGDGKELFYVARDGRLMAVTIAFPSEREVVEAGVPVPLFASRMDATVLGAPPFVVSPDGQRFLIETRVEGPPSPITVIQHWGLSPRQPSP